MIDIASRDTFNILVEDNKFCVRSNSYEDAARFSWNVDRHSNAEYEIHIILKGECIIGIENKQYIIKEGDLVIIAPGVFHSSQVLSNTFDHFAAGFSSSSEQFKDQLFMNIPRYYIGKATEKMNILCLQYLNECDNNSSFSFDFKKSVITQLIILLLREMNIEDKTASAEHRENNPIDIIDQFFEQYFSSKSGERILSDMLGLSIKQLSSLLLKTYGRTYREKIIETRVEHSKWLLLNTNQSIQQISINTGYSSSSAFYNMFRAEVGCSPLEYRKTKVQRGKNE